MAAELIEMMRDIALDARHAAKSLESVTADDVEELLRTTQEAVNVLQEVQRLAVNSALRFDVWSNHGFRSPAHWLTTLTGTPLWLARSIVERAEVMSQLPLAQSVALAGGLHEIQVRDLAKLAERAGPFSDVDVDLEAAAAADDGPAAFATAVSRMHQRLDGEEAKEEAEAEDACSTTEGAGEPLGGDRCLTPPGRMTLQQRPDGWWVGAVLLPPIDGEIVSAALDREIDRYLRSQRDGDPSLAKLEIPNLRAQALIDLVAIRREPSAYSTPDRFQVALNLHVQPDGTVRPDGLFPPEAICDSVIYRIALGAHREVLDVGRATRQWTPALSRAIRRRDQHCQFPDCDRPSRSCDIHHCQHWEHDGTTSIRNGVLLCRWHHTFIHQHRWQIELHPDTQQPTVYRSDGTIHTTAARRAARE